MEGGIKDFFLSIWDFIKNFFKKIWEFIKNIAQTIWDFFKRIFNFIFNRNKKDVNSLEEIEKRGYYSDSEKTSEASNSVNVNDVTIIEWFNNDAILNNKSKRHEILKSSFNSIKNFIDSMDKDFDEFDFILNRMIGVNETFHKIVLSKYIETLNLKKFQSDYEYTKEDTDIFQTTIINNKDSSDEHTSDSEYKKYSEDMNRTISEVKDILKFSQNENSENSDTVKMHRIFSNSFSKNNLPTLSYFSTKHNLLQKIISGHLENPEFNELLSDIRASDKTYPLFKLSKMEKNRYTLNELGFNYNYCKHLLSLKNDMECVSKEYTGKKLEKLEKNCQKILKIVGENSKFVDAIYDKIINPAREEMMSRKKIFTDNTSKEDQERLNKFIMFGHYVNKLEVINLLFLKNYSDIIKNIKELWQIRNVLISSFCINVQDEISSYVRGANLKFSNPKIDNVNDIIEEQKKYPSEFKSLYSSYSNKFKN